MVLYNITSRNKRVAVLTGLKYNYRNYGYISCGTVVTVYTISAGEFMILTINIDDKAQQIEVSEELLKEGDDFFQKMDADMDKGWQMSREWIEKPDQIQRCQIVADKILSAISSENETMLMLMSGYIVSRVPNVESVHIDTSGEMMETEIRMR